MKKILKIFGLYLYNEIFEWMAKKTKENVQGKDRVLLLRDLKTDKKTVRLFFHVYWNFYKRNSSFEYFPVRNFFTETIAVLYLKKQLRKELLRIPN